MLYKQQIKDAAREVGFDLCGVARCENLDGDAQFLRQWIADGHNSSLGYMARNVDKRADISLLVEGARTVIVCGMAYKNRFSDGYADDCRTKVASYALMQDYHTTIRGRLRELQALLEQRIGHRLVGRVFVDSAPVFEKRYAVQAGLGWIGRQSLLITPQYGSFLLLGELVVTDECDEYDQPYSGIGCGECHRCVDACPNSAICRGHIDTRRCISRATVESLGEDDIDTHGWIFGCDMCQTICPYNKQAPYSAIEPLFDPDTIVWTDLGDDEFAVRFKETPLGRSSAQRIKTIIEKK